MKKNNIKDTLKKIRWSWIKFWGRRYWIYNGDVEVNEIIFYKHRIYIIK